MTHMDPCATTYLIDKDGQIERVFIHAIEQTMRGVLSSEMLQVGHQITRRIRIVLQFIYKTENRVNSWSYHLNTAAALTQRMLQLVHSEYTDQSQPRVLDLRL